jgi:hypothetical protein
MAIQEIQRQLRTQPFEPFRILTTDGRSYDVRHPEYLAFGGKGRLISVGMGDDSFATIDLLLVTAVIKPIPQDEPQRAAG